MIQTRLASKQNCTKSTLPTRSLVWIRAQGKVTIRVYVCVKFDVWHLLHWIVAWPVLDRENIIRVQHQQKHSDLSCVPVPALHYACLFRSDAFAAILGSAESAEVNTTVRGSESTVAPSLSGTVAYPTPPKPIFRQQNTYRHRNPELFPRPVRTMRYLTNFDIWYVLDQYIHDSRPIYLLSPDSDKDFVNDTRFPNCIISNNVFPAEWKTCQEYSLSQE